MSFLKTAIVAGCLVVLSGSAYAQGAPTPPSTPTPLEGVTVYASKGAPGIVSVYPAAGATAAPGITILKVVFDQGMDAESWGFGANDGAGAPTCLRAPRLLADQKTFVLLCETQPGVQYDLRLNAGPGKGFASLAGDQAKPFEWRFSTSSDEPVRTLDDAMKTAQLKVDESPVMDVGLTLRGAAQTAQR